MFAKSNLPAITGATGDPNNALLVLPPALQPWRPTIVSYTASLGSTIIGFPLDSIKTRMQAYRYNGVLDCLDQTVKNEGFKGLFRGITAPLLSIACSKSLQVSLYSWLKPAIQEAEYRYSSFPRKSSSQMILMNVPASFLGGAITGSLVSLWSCPFELTKLYSQLSMVEASKQLGKAHIERSLFLVVKQIVSSTGVLGLYSGLKLQIYREFLGGGLYFSVYESAKLSILSISSESKVSGPMAVAIGGALSGVISWCVIFPIDTLKSMVQRDIVAGIIRYGSQLDRSQLPNRKLQRPTLRMYRGLSVSVTRSVLNSLVFFSLFEYLMGSIA